MDPGEEKQMENVKTGLVLEGGGMRGIYTAGVLDVFMEEGLYFDGVIGVSAGAIHGASFVARQRGRSIRYYKKYCRDKRFMSLHSLLTTGDIVGEEFCYHTLPDTLDPFDHDTFEASDTKFYAVCTNVATGKAEYLQIRDMRSEVDIMRASASMPYVTKIVNWRGKKYLDGGCADSIPLEASEKLGYTVNVVVRTRDPEYRKKEKPAKKGKKDLAGIVYRSWPRFAQTLRNRPSAYNRTVEELHRRAAAGDIFLIEPSEKLTIGRVEHDPEKLQAVYDIGVRDAKAKLQELKEWLAART